MALGKGVLCAEDGGGFLHGALHGVAKGGGGCAS